MFYYYLVTFIIPRMIFQWTDERNAVTSYVKISVINLILLLPAITENNWHVLLLTVLAIHFICFFLENKLTAININGTRLIQFAIILCFASSFYQGNGSEFHFNHLSQNFWTWLRTHNSLLSVFYPRQNLIYITGLLILINEANHLIRYILNKIKVQPKHNDQVDSNELTRGKIIGVLERIIIFSFAMAGNLSSIGFILAAKAFTRCKELDDKDFAEYVLIGTLLSAAITIFIAYFFRYILNINN